MATADMEQRYTKAEVIEWLRADMHALSDRAAAYLLTLPVGSKSLRVSADPDQQAEDLPHVSTDALMHPEALPVTLERPVGQCPFPGCDITTVHNLKAHPDGYHWAAEHDLWDEQRFVAGPGYKVDTFPPLTQRGSTWGC